LLWLAALSAFGLPKQLRLFVVESGSMAPVVKTGSLVLVRPSDTYQKGDIITYKVEAEADIKNPKLTITHRIHEIKKENGLTYYTTKGDRNDLPDMNPAPSNWVLGKVVATIPLLGHPVGFAKTQTGFILLIVIPATIIVYSELTNIKNEAKKLLAERKKRRLTLKPVRKRKSSKK